MLTLMEGKRTYHSTQYRLLKTCYNLSLIILVEMYKTTQIYPFIIIHNNSPHQKRKKKKRENRSHDQYQSKFYLEFYMENL